MKHQESPVNDLADTMNHGCLCRTLDVDLLRQELGRDAVLRDMAAGLAHTHPHLFSSTAVFASLASVQAIEQAVAAIERTMALPAWTQHALSQASAVAQVDHGPAGVFMGYDFHLTPKGPQLIEVNTNAGGAMLNAVLLSAQVRCCGMTAPLPVGYPDPAAMEDGFFAMFQAEWDLFKQHRGQAGEALRSVAIVDDQPDSQYLAPEFALFAELFKRHGVQAVVVDAAALHVRNQRLHSGNLPIDLVYNRVTDFDLSSPAHATLAHAYAEDLAAVTPHPRAYALRANKQHLVTLGDPAALQGLGVPAADLETLLATVPACERVTPGNAAQLWGRRKHLFFKPLGGFGARAVYRGDKITTRVWDEIQRGNYIAQTLVPPDVRATQVGDAATDLKFDLRAYTYRGRVQLLAARTYSGQTTNFRTDGGGFAPVMWVPQV